MKSRLFTLRVLLMLALGVLPLGAKADSLLQEQFVLSDYKGQFVYMDFWASWCGPCRASFPWMNQMHKDLSSKGLKIVAVNVDSDASDAEAFLRELPAEFLIVFDPEGKMAKKRQLMGMPSSYFYGPDGTLLFSHVGFNESDKAGLRNKIEALLAQSKEDL